MCDICQDDYAVYQLFHRTLYVYVQLVFKGVYIIAISLVLVRLSNSFMQFDASVV